MSHKNPKAVVDYRAYVHALRPLALNGKIPKELFVATMKQNLPEVPKAPAAYIREIRNLRSLLSNGKIIEEEYEKKKEDCKQITNTDIIVEYVDEIKCKECGGTLIKFTDFTSSVIFSECESCGTKLEVKIKDRTPSEPIVLAKADTYREYEERIDLEHVIIPNNVTVIGGAAFWDCINLTSIIIPNSVTWIQARAFCDCESLSSINIPDSVIKVGEYAFKNCINLTNATIGKGMSNICQGMFCGCKSLTSIVIPNSVTVIDYRAFSDCIALSYITIPNSVVSIGEFAFRGCTSLTDITIPSSVTSIGRNAFFKCDNLTNITIPKSVTSIGYGAFHYCTNLTSVTFEDPIGWCVSDIESVHSKATNVDVTDPARAAKRLKKTYARNYWHKE